MSDLHGWFSEKQYIGFGGCFYKRCNGETVLITHVSADPNDSGCSWPDIKYVGPVTGYDRDDGIIEKNKK